MLTDLINVFLHHSMLCYMICDMYRKVDLSFVAEKSYNITNATFRCIK